MNRKENNLDFYLRAVEEKFETFKQDLTQLISALSAEDAAKKKAVAEATLGSLNNLLAMISKQDYPVWASQLHSELGIYVQKYKTSGASNRLINVVIRQYPQIHSKTQTFATITIGNPLDFESVYRKFYKQSRISELFELLVHYLQKTVDSGQVDSLKAIDALNDLIATIRTNMKGTYFQTVGASRFAKSLFRNYLRKLLKKIPTLGTLLESIEETFHDLDIEMSEVHAQVTKELGKYAEGEVELVSFDQKRVLEHNDNTK